MLFAGALLFAVVCLGLAACSGPGRPVPAALAGGSTASSAQANAGPVTDAQANVAPVTGTTGKAVPPSGSSAHGTDRLVGIMEAALRGAGPTPGQEALRSRLVAAGVPSKSVEVSASRTPTGLDVDAVEAAASSGTECVVGEVRNGLVAVTVLPLLADGRCFAGDSR